jgi:osmotically-inducible protein OsmY
MDLQYQYLVARLQEALAADARVNSLDIKVTVTGGRIHLIGEVPSEERRTAIAEVAAEVCGEAELRNEITVLELAPRSSSAEVIHD